jgi:steroid 5-alpha reductase family enzyme
MSGAPRAVPAPLYDLAVVVLAYLAALAAAVYVGRTVHDMHPLVIAGAADLAATIVIFTFSVAYDNSSMYDAYWSVVPPALGVFWLASAPPDVPATRQALVLLLVFAWGIRLTVNWLRGWRGLGHEDWRYVQMRGQTGGGYWLASLTGLHLAPTAVVFLACVPMFLAVARGTAPIGALDGLATAVTALAIAVETIADVQLHRFRAGAAPGATLTTGLWAYSRHPNYFGEALFWWGLWLFGVASGHAPWWTVAGPAAITAMLRFVSIPLIDARMQASRPDYETRMRRVSALVPWFPSREPGR